MGLKKFTNKRSELKLWINKLNGQGYDTSTLKTIYNVHNFMVQTIRNEDDTKHDDMITFIKQNQVLVNTSILLDKHFEDFIDDT